MYNRYIRNDKGVYTRIPEPDAPSEHPGASGSAHGQEHSHRQNTPPDPPPPPPKPPPHHSVEGFSGTLRKLLDRFHLENVDTGDLLLLLLILLLFREDADDELLFALGLLLIL